jgi:hypothetical protein
MHNQRVLAKKYRLKANDEDIFERVSKIIRTSTSEETLSRFHQSSISNDDHDVGLTCEQVKLIFILNDLHLLISRVLRHLDIHIVSPVDTVILDYRYREVYLLRHFQTKLHLLYLIINHQHKKNHIIFLHVLGDRKILVLQHKGNPNQQTFCHTQNLA